MKSGLLLDQILTFGIYVYGSVGGADSQRDREPLTSTGRLSDIIKAAIPAPARRTGGNPAKRTFQALRIEVNGELEALSQALPAAMEALAAKLEVAGVKVARGSRALADERHVKDLIVFQDPAGTRIEAFHGPEIAGTPFERVLNEAITEIVLEPDGAGTRITIEQRQKLRGYSRTGGWLLRRATRAKLGEAIDGIEHACG